MIRTQRPYGTTDRDTAILHRDGTVTLYCPHRASWVRGYPTGADIAHRADAARITAHLGRTHQPTE